MMPWRSALLVGFFKRRGHAQSIVAAPRLRAMLQQRCPVCFQGAMYVSYGIGIVYLGILGLAANAFIVPRFGLVPAVGLVVAVHLACIPAVFRYSRVIWAHVNVRTMRP
jgi:hypothetical protein